MLVRLMLALSLVCTVMTAALAQEPIRVGFLTILTGALAAPGKDMENGIELFIKEHQGALRGRRIELTVVDSGGQPAGTLARARELVGQRKVNVIIGPPAA